LEGTDAAPGALAATERVFAVTAALLRLGALVLLALALLTAGLHRRLDLIGLAAAGEAVLFVVLASQARRLRPWPVALDLLAVAVVFAVTSGGLARGVQTPLYNYGAITVGIVGLVDWPLWTVLLVALIPNLVVVGSAVLPRQSNYPLWIAIPDALGSLGIVCVAWVIATLQRRVARARDRQREQAVAHAHELARERERQRQADTLRYRLLSTLDDLTMPAVVPDRVLADQVRREADWLRTVVARGLPEPSSAGLVHCLHEVVAGKRASGLAVDLIAPSFEPDVSGAASEAFAGAALEALTNVAKHSGTAAARVIVTADPDATVVAVEDRGCGYDPARVPAGLGQARSIHRRMAEIGGTAQVESAPGQGTRVTLRLAR
jgi:signal transduction histidine kinase